MRLRDILEIFHNELDEIYGKHEVDSFFYLLIGHYLNLDRIRLALEPEYALTKLEEQPLFEALSQLKLESPFQYIIGETEFYGLPIRVNAHTLIPRPETEELVSWVVSDHINPKEEETLAILDIGTGSGCIAIALASALPKAKVFAMDVSKDAIKVARQNALLNAVDIQFLKFNILDESTWNFKDLNLKFDIIVSNPPYVREMEKAEMSANVLENEPHLALFVDDDHPLQFYNAICGFSKRYLKNDGVLYFEINENLGQEMVDLLNKFEFQHIELRPDIFGKDRMIRGKKPSKS